MLYTKHIVTSKYYNVDFLQNSVIADIKLCVYNSVVWAARW